MSNTVEAILQSLEDLSKRNLKRTSAQWTSKLSLLYSLRNKILASHIIHIAKHLVNNNLQLQEAPRLLLSHSLPKIIDKTGLSLLDSSTIAYAYATIGEDHSSKKILINNFDSSLLNNASNSEYSSLLKILSTLLSREAYYKVNDDVSKTIRDIAKDVIVFMWKRIRELNSNFVNNGSNYGVISEILSEYIFVSAILNKAGIQELLNHSIIDDSSILSRIKLSPWMPQDKKTKITSEIQLANYTEILTTLRGIYFLKLSNFEFTEYLFNRLCNTTESSTRICRFESSLFLNHTLDLIEKELKFGESGKIKYLTTLYNHLLAIKRTYSLEKSHRSTLKWNYPRFIQ